MEHKRAFCHAAQEIIDSLKDVMTGVMSVVLLTPTHLAIVMKYAAGGELYDRILMAGRFSEDEARYFFQQLISGVRSQLLPFNGANDQGLPPPLWETQLDESSDLGHIHPGYMLNGQQAGIYLSPMQSSQQSAMYIYSQLMQGGQTTGYNAYYSQRPPYNYNTSPNEISQGMYSVNLQDTYSNSNAGPSYHMPTTSYVPQFNRPSKPEDKLFGDLVNMAKTKQNKIPPSNTGDL